MVVVHPTLLAPPIGSELKKARLELGLTQEDLAWQCDLHVTYIGLVENGKRIPTLRTFLNLCACLQVKPSRILSRGGH